MDRSSETIVAVSSSPLPAARAIVRMSGADALSIAAGVFRANGAAVGRAASWCALGGVIVLDGWPPVAGRLYVMPAPASYTREDVCEIHTTGCAPVVRAVVEACVAAGARPAEAGEFTRRAFLSGRIDLAHAEAVAELIAAQTDSEGAVAAEALAGGLSDAAHAVSAELLDILADLEGDLDFSESEGFVPVGAEALAARLRDAERRLRAALGESESRDMSRERLPVHVLGVANAGKSTLVNALAGAQVAITDGEAGTTRDVLDAPVQWDGLALVLRDGPGAGDESGGHGDAFERAQARARSAALVVLVVDATRGAGALEEAVIESFGPARVLVALNKIDLCGGEDADAGAGTLSLESGAQVVAVSALTGEGVGHLRERIVERLVTGPQRPAGFALSVRQRDAFMRALAAAARARGALDPRDLAPAAVDVREAVECVGDVTGASVSEEVLERIFANFCVGK